MAVYRNTVPRALGLNFSGLSPRLVGPGETFTAAPSEIPAGFLAVGDIVLVSADPEPVAAPVETPAADAEPTKGK